jgi:4-hydroxy-tetrahydrodipicolinate reductase
MGRRIVALAEGHARLQVVAEIDVEGALSGRDVLDRGPIDAVVDVSSDAGARAAVALARRHRAALLVATTALHDETSRLIDEAAREIPVLVSSNLSPGVAVQKLLAGLAARLLGPAYDIAIVEHHHALKRDAPSGTALSLADAIARESGRDVPAGHIASTRGGDVVGEHLVRFAGPGEYLELRHTATTRDLFAEGAIRAVEWLVEQPPGRWSIEQMLSIGERDRPERHRTLNPRIR